MVGFGGGEKPPRSQQIAAGIAQTQQQLVLPGLAAGQLNDGLGMQLETVMGQRIVHELGPSTSLRLQPPSLPVLYLGRPVAKDEYVPLPLRAGPEL